MNGKDNKNTDTTKPFQTSLLDVIEGLMKVMQPATEDVLALINQVDVGMYKSIRAEINLAFSIGELAEFTGSVEEDTEFGDLTDVIQLKLEARFPVEEFKGKAHSIMLTTEERTEWRDELINGLDQMVAQ